MVLSERPPACLLQTLQSISQSAVHVRWKSDLVRECADDIILLLFRSLSDHSCLVEDLLKRQIESILQSYPALRNRVSSGLMWRISHCTETILAQRFYWTLVFQCLLFWLHNVHVMSVRLMVLGQGTFSLDPELKPKLTSTKQVVPKQQVGWTTQRLYFMWFTSHYVHELSQPSSIHFVLIT